MEVGARDVQGLPPLAQPAPRQSYAPMAGKPAPSSHEPPRQWNQAPTTLIYQWRKKGGGGMGVKERSKGQTKRMAAKKTLYWAHGGDASKADRAWAKRLTADHVRAPCC